LPPLDFFSFVDTPIPKKGLLNPILMLARRPQQPVTAEIVPD